MLGKLLGKKSGFYLELSEEEIAAIPAATATATTATAATATAATATAATAPAATATAATATQAQPAAPAPKAPTAPAPKASKKETPVAPAVTSSITDPQELIRTALAAAANKPAPVAEPPTPTFSDYVPKPVMSRRRPGPSMSSFKTMSKEMRASKSGF